MNKIDAFIYEFKHRKQYIFLFTRNNLKKENDFIINELDKADTFLLFGETFSHNKITKAIFIGLNVFFVVAPLILACFIAIDFIEFVARKADITDMLILVDGYHPIIQYGLFTILAVDIGVILPLVYISLTDWINKWLPVSNFGEMKIRGYFLKNKDYVNRLCEKYKLSPSIVLSRLEWRVGLKEKPEGRTYFITILALVISIITLFNEEILQTAFESLYDWRMVLWTIVIVCSICAPLFCLSYLRTRKNYKEDQYLLSILEEIVYCDKEDGNK